MRYASNEFQKFSRFYFYFCFVLLRTYVLLLLSRLKEKNVESEEF